MWTHKGKTENKKYTIKENNHMKYIQKMKMNIETTIRK